MRTLIIREKQLKNLQEAKIIQMTPGSQYETGTSYDNYTPQQRAAYLYPPELLEKGDFKQYALVSVENQYEFPKYFWKKASAIREKLINQRITGNKYVIIDLKKLGIPLGMPEKNDAGENTETTTSAEKEAYYTAYSPESKATILKGLDEGKLQGTLELLALIIVGKEPLSRFGTISEEEMRQATDALSEWCLDYADEEESKGDDVLQKISKEYQGQKWNHHELAAEMRYRINKKLYSSLPFVLNDEISHLRQRYNIISDGGTYSRALRLSNVLDNCASRGGSNIDFVSMMKDYDWETIKDNPMLFRDTLPLIHDQYKNFISEHPEYFDSQEMLPWQQEKQKKYLKQYQNLVNTLNAIGYNVKN